MRYILKDEDVPREEMMMNDDRPRRHKEWNTWWEDLCEELLEVPFKPVPHREPQSGQRKQQESPEHENA